MSLDPSRSRFCRLLGVNGALWQLLLGLCGFACVLGLMASVFLTVALLEGVDWSWTWLGLVLLPAGVLAIQCLNKKELGATSAGADPANVPVAGDASRCGPTAIESVVLQVLIILLFALLMDGGLHLQACMYSYLAYAAGALIILVRRARALTNIDLIYLTWGWLPIIVIGVPLFVRVWKAKGLL